MLQKQQNRHKRHKKIRARIKGTSKRPRLSVFRSNLYIYGQLIDDEKGNTLASVSDSQLKGEKIKTEDKMSAKVKIAYQLGQLIAKKALKLDIKEVLFDRGGYKYHGRIKAVADGAREGGLKF